MTPEEDLVDHILTKLASITLPLVAGTNLFEGPMREPDGTYVTNPAVFVQETGIGRIEPYIGGATADDYSIANVGILVVSPRQGYEEGRTLARELLAVCHKAVIAGYTKVICLQASPLAFEDNEGRPMFSLNLTMEWKALRGLP